MKVNQSAIRKMTLRYREWLLNKQWFNENIENKDEWLKPLNDIIEKKANTPTLLWEAIVDHWQAGTWTEESRPQIFVELYDLIDEYRISREVDAVNDINILIDALRLSANQDKYPQVVISELYEHLTGETLVRDTDPSNGEDYLYKGNDVDALASLALHPEVSDYFNFKCNKLNVNGTSIFNKGLKNWQIANELSCKYG